MKDEREQQHLGEIGLDNFAPYLMNRIMGRYNSMMRDELVELGLTTPKMRALAVLAIIDGILIGQLAVYAVVEYSTLSRTLDAMEKDGLVQRNPDGEDARAIRISITPEGRTTFEKLWPRMAETSAQMFEGISDDERRSFTTTLQKILRNIRVHDF